MDETPVTSFAELQQFSNRHRGWLFRGMRSPNWELDTSLERAARRCKMNPCRFEKLSIYEFRRHCHGYLLRVPHPDHYVEWLALMQHYGAPTRFLDFTRSFWIALHFAYESADNDCVVWALDSRSLGKKAKKDFNILIRENIEKGAHTEDVLYEDVPYFTNERLAIQKGTFVFSMNQERTFNDIFTANKKTHRRLVISEKLFPEIRRYLNEMNCTSRVLFPGIDGYARHFNNFADDGGVL
ncbi:FRG domain-containing protein [Anatilimnocola sp. NA78]|uniref:FRG domain-containing protein n=1 Tax=Anatilimnocola sp. NA78 TaxID=3415683 RepID=UPI003CE52FBF